MKCVFGLVLCALSAAFVQAQPVRQPDFTISGEATESSAGLAFSPEGRFLAVSGSNNAVGLCRVQAGGKLKAGRSETFTGHKSPVIALGFDGAEMLVSVSLDQTVKIWNMTSGRLLHTAELNAGQEFIPALAPGKEPLLATGTSNQVTLWNYESGERLKTFEVHDSNVSTLAFTPDGKLLVVGTTKGVIRVLDVGAGKLARIIDMDTPIHALAASADRILVGYADGTLNLLSLGDENSIPEIKAHDKAISAVAFSPKGDRFASGSIDGNVKVWDGETLKLLCTLKGQTAEVVFIAFSPDGHQLAAAGADGEVRVWPVR